MRNSILRFQQENREALKNMVNYIQMSEAEFGEAFCELLVDYISANIALTDELVLMLKKVKGLMEEREGDFLAK